MRAGESLYAGPQEVSGASVKALFLRREAAKHGKTGRALGTASQDPPLHRPRHGRGGAGAVPRHPHRHRAGHRGGLLLRLPAAPAPEDRGPGPDRGAHEGHHRRGAPLPEAGGRPRGGPGAVPRGALQAGADPGPAGRGGDQPVFPGGLHRPVPRPARGLHPRAARRRLQAAFHRRRLLAGRRAQPDAHPHLRHRLGEPPGAGRLPEEAGGDREAGPPPPGPGAGPVLHPRGGRGGADLLAPQGGPHPGHRGGLLAAQAFRQRLRGGEHPAHRQEPGCGRPPGTWASTPRTCTPRSRSTRPTTTSSP